MPTSPKPPKRSLPPEFDSESEGEYEYSATETEVPISPFPPHYPPPKPSHLKPPSQQTHYITLDLTSQTNTPTPTVSHKKKRRDPFHPTIPAPAPKPRSRAARITKAARKLMLQRQIDTLTEAEPLTERENGLATEAETADVSADAQGRGQGQPSQLQILDLDTANPLISYRGTIYSCEWTQPLGTDVLLAPPDSAVYRDEDGEGEGSGDGGSRVINGAAGDEGPVVAFSEYRLMARPVKALPVGRQGGIKKKRAPEKGTENGAGDGKLNQNENGSNERRVRFAEPTQGTASVPADVEEGDVIPAATASTPEQLPRPPPQPFADTPTSQRPSSTPTPAPSYQSPYPSQPIVTSTAPPPAAGPSQTSQPASNSLHPESSEPPTPSQRPQTSLISTLNPNATPLRTAQATFLEKLISAKKSHGETDAVTVYATKPPTGTGWGMQAKARARLVATVHETRKKNGKDKGRDQEVILIEDKGSDEEEDEAGDERDVADGEKGDVEGNERHGENLGHGVNERRGAAPGPRRRRGNLYAAPLRTLRKDPYAAFQAIGKGPIVGRVQQPVVTPRAAFEKDVDTAMRDPPNDRAGEEDDSRSGEGNQRS